MEHIMDHADRAQARLRQQFRASPDMVALARVMGTRTQALEDALWAIRAAARVPNAGGRTSGRDETLVRVGRIIGALPYGGENANVYSHYLDTQVLLNKSNCTVADLLSALFADWFGLDSVVMDADFPGTSVYGTLPGTGSVVLESSTVVPADYSTLTGMNLTMGWGRQTVAAGIRLLLGGWTPPDINTPGTLFRFDQLTSVGTHFAGGAFAVGDVVQDNELVMTGTVAAVTDTGGVETITLTDVTGTPTVDSYNLSDVATGTKVHAGTAPMTITGSVFDDTAATLYTMLDTPTR